MWTPEIIGLVVAAVFGGGGIGGYLTYRQAVIAARVEKDKIRAEHVLAVETARAAQTLAMDTAKAAQLLAATNQPVDHYRSLVEIQGKRIDKLEQDHGNCVEHQLKCEHAMGELKGQVNVLTQIIQGSGVTLIPLNDPMEPGFSDMDTMKLPQVKTNGG